MRNDLSESVFDAVLKKAFCDYNYALLDSYPDCETLSKKHPLPKKERRSFDRTAKEMKYGKSLVRVYLSRVAVIILCFVTLAAAVMMTSSTVRASVKNVIMEWFEKYTLFTFVSTEPEEGDFENVEDVKIGYVPDGYELVDTTNFSGTISYDYSLNNSADDLYIIDVFRNETTDLFSDNERSKYTKTDINGREAWIVYDDKLGEGSLVLVGAKISVLISGNLPKSEFIKIAESIK